MNSTSIDFTRGGLAARRTDTAPAARNWRKWQAVFEHADGHFSNPLLEDAEVFSEFMWEYSVNRTIRAGKQDEFRLALRSDRFLKVLNDHTGAGLDKEEARLRPRFGVQEGKRRVRSALSKVAAFLAPHDFIAYDKFALKGLGRLIGRSVVKDYTYSEYLLATNELLAGPLGERIRRFCVNNYPTPYASKRQRFHRRILDTYLMRIGGRY